MACAAVFGGSVGGYVGDYVGQLAVWRLCWDYVGQLGALLAASESHVGPFGGYVVTMLGSWGSAGCF